MKVHLSEVPRLQPEEVKERGREACCAVSNGIVKLLRLRAGRGPRKARTLISSDLVVVTMRDNLTTSERTLLEAGLFTQVADTRRALHETLREEARQVVEDAVGKRVVAFLADQQYEPDVAVFAFVLHRPGEAE